MIESDIDEETTLVKKYLDFLLMVTPDVVHPVILENNCYLKYYYREKVFRVVKGQSRYTGQWSLCSITESCKSDFLDHEKCKYDMRCVDGGDSLEEIFDFVVNNTEFISDHIGIFIDRRFGDESMPWTSIGELMDSLFADICRLSDAEHEMAEAKKKAASKAAAEAKPSEGLSSRLTNSMLRMIRPKK